MHYVRHAYNRCTYYYDSYCRHTTMTPTTHSAAIWPQQPTTRSSTAWPNQRFRCFCSQTVLLAGTAPPRPLPPTCEKQPRGCKPTQSTNDNKTYSHALFLSSVTEISFALFTLGKYTNKHIHVPLSSFSLSTRYYTKPNMQYKIQCTDNLRPFCHFQKLLA